MLIVYCEGDYDYHGNFDVVGYATSQEEAVAAVKLLQEKANANPCSCGFVPRYDWCDVMPIQEVV